VFHRFGGYPCTFTVVPSLKAYFKSCQRTNAHVISLHFPLEVTRNIQGDSGGKVNVLGSDTIGHCEKEKSTFDHVSHSEWFPR